MGKPLSPGVAGIATLFVCLGLLVACGDQASPVADTAASDQTSSTEPQAEAPSPTATRSEPSKQARPQRTGTRIVSRDSDFGTILFDDTGQAIYIFEVEKTSEPRCYGACAEAWPPVYAKGRPRAGGAVKAAMLGTVERDDGGVQVTYNGHPLYYYVHEGKGEVKCHDVFLNGGSWYAVMPDGDRAP